MDIVTALRWFDKTFPAVKKPFWQLFYNVMALQPANQVIQFMNYGIHLDPDLELKENDLPNRYRIQLYHRLASNISLEQKDIIEVGCGRGGGCSYFSRYFNLKSMVGIDLSKRNIKICNNLHKEIERLTFKVADAENLPFENQTKDIIFNLESSHCYPNMDKFLSESYRILKENGYLSFGDFILTSEINNLKKRFSKAGYEIIEEDNLTLKVLDAIRLDNELNKFNETNRIFKINLRKLTGAADENSAKGLIAMFKSGQLSHIHFLLKK